jgi:hypothetical protein
MTMVPHKAPTIKVRQLSFMGEFAKAQVFQPDSLIVLSFLFTRQGNGAEFNGLREEASGFLGSRPTTQ